jgi:WD40 repeat protein
MDATSPEPPSVAQKIGRHLLDLFYGDDVFISYSRADGSSYVEGLADELTRRGFSCFLDQLGTDPDEGLPASLVAKIRGCTVCVLVASPRALISEAVRKEIEIFRKTRRAILPINFGTTPEAHTRRLVPGVAFSNETPEALDSGEPSQSIIDRIVKSFNYTRRNARMRRILLLSVIAFLILMALIAYAGFRAQRELSRADDATKRVTIEQQRAEQFRKIGDEQKLELERVRMEVESESRKAEEARGEREAALSEAASALRDAALARNETARQQEIAEGFNWANQAEMRRNQGLDSLRGGVALAMKSMARFFRLGVADLQADRTLRKGAVLLRPFKEVPAPFEFGAGAMALSPDGRFIAICAESPYYRPFVKVLTEIWSVSGKPHKTGSLPDLTPECQDLGFHQGRLIVIGNEGSVWSCEAWDTPAPKCRKLYDLDDDLASLKSGGGQLLSISSSANVIQFWDLAGSSEPLSQLALKDLRVEAGLLSLEGDLLAIASFNSSPYTETVHILDTKSGEEQARFLATDGSSSRTIKSLALNARADLLAASLTNKYLGESEIIVWDFDGDAELLRLSLQEEVNDIAISPDGLSLVVGSRRGTRIWDLASQAEIALLQGGYDGLTFNADGRWLAAKGEFKRAALIWDLQQSLLEVPPVELGLGSANRMVLSQNGRYFAVPTELGTQVWDLVSTKQIDELAESFDMLKALDGPKLVFSPSGRYLIGGDTYSRSWLLEVGTGRSGALPPLLGASFDQEERLLALFGPGGIEIRRVGEDRARISVPVKPPVLKAEMSPRSRYLAFAGSSPFLEIWSLDMESKRTSRIEQLPLNGKLLDLAWSADERYLAVSLKGGFILIRNAGSRPAVTTLRSTIVDFGFTAKGERLVAVGRDGTLWVCELRGTCAAWTATCSSVPLHLALHPEGRYAAVALGDETTEVWDLLRRRRVAHFENGIRLDDLGFSADGRLLVGLDMHESSVRQWLWHPEDLIREAALRLFPSNQ